MNHARWQRMNAGCVARAYSSATYIITSRLEMDACFIGEDSFDVTSASSPCRHVGLSNGTRFAEPALHQGAGLGPQLSDGHPVMEESASTRLQHVQKPALIARPSRGTNVSDRSSPWICLRQGFFTMNLVCKYTNWTGWWCPVRLCSNNGDVVSQPCRDGPSSSSLYIYALNSPTT